MYAFEDDDKDYDYQVRLTPQTHAISHPSNHIQYPEKEDGWNYAGTNQRLKKDRIGGGGGGGRRPRWQRRRPFRRHHAPGLWVVSLDWLWRVLTFYPTIILFYVELKTFHIVIFCEIHIYVWYTNKTFFMPTCLGLFGGRQVLTSVTMYCRTISRLERLANFVSKPMGAMARVSHAVNNPGGFLKQFANRWSHKSIFLLEGIWSKVR